MFYCVIAVSRRVSGTDDQRPEAVAAYTWEVLSAAAQSPRSRKKEDS